MGDNTDGDGVDDDGGVENGGGVDNNNCVEGCFVRLANFFFGFGDNVKSMVSPDISVFTRFFGSKNLETDSLLTWCCANTAFFFKRFSECRLTKAVILAEQGFSTLCNALQYLHFISS